MFRFPPRNRPHDQDIETEDVQETATALGSSCLAETPPLGGEEEEKGKESVGDRVAHSKPAP